MPITREERRARIVALAAALLAHAVLLGLSLPSRSGFAPPAGDRGVTLTPWQAPRPPRAGAPPKPKHRDPELETSGLAPVSLSQIAPPGEPAGAEAQESEDPAADAPASRILAAGAETDTVPSLIGGTRVQPVYPVRARLARVEGRVVMRAVIFRDGRVGEIEVISVPAPNLGFEQSAIDAVSRWRYHPALLESAPVDSSFTIIIDYRLR